MPGGSCDLFRTWCHRPGCLRCASLTALCTPRKVRVRVCVPFAVHLKQTQHRRSTVLPYKLDVNRECPCSQKRVRTWGLLRGCVCALTVPHEHSERVAVTALMVPGASPAGRCLLSGVSAHGAPLMPRVCTSCGTKGEVCSLTKFAVTYKF